MTQKEKVADVLERTKTTMTLLDKDAAIEALILCKRFTQRSRIKSEEKKSYISLLEDMYCSLRKADEVSLPTRKPVY